jgi:hypothetical protein
MRRIKAMQYLQDHPISSIMNFLACVAKIFRIDWAVFS